MMRRKRSSKFSRRRQVTGIPPRMYIKVRKDILYTVTGGATSWNSLIVGGAQVCGPSTFSYFNGASVSAIDPVIDTSTATSIAQWLNFYNGYYVCGSKMKVTLQSQIGTLIATLVPTLQDNLACDKATGAVSFDNRNIDPGELPYSKRAMLNYLLGGGTKTLSSYVSVKRMLGVKDLGDVATDVIVAATNSTEPYVPRIGTASSTGISIQPNTGVGQAGIYWNLVIQNVSQNQTTIPVISVEPSFSLRMQVTSYICLQDRKTLLTA